jgi:hypothetical protein
MRLASIKRALLMLALVLPATGQAEGKLLYDPHRIGGLPN